MKQTVTNTEILMFILGWQGGTIHQLSKHLMVTENRILDADYEEMQLLMRLAQSRKQSIHNNKEPRFPIGTKYKSKGKHPRECTVIDIHYTYNIKGKLVHFRYVTEHDFMGQKVTERDVCETTIAMGFIE